MTNLDVLFFLKERASSQIWHHCEHDYSHGGHLSSGLFNSANFVHEMLVSNGVRSEMVTVFDANSINKHVSICKPQVVIIEALWVTPTKLRELHKIHPSVVWIVRNHSRIPFLSTEGIAMDFIIGYADIPQVFVASNHHETTRDIRSLFVGRGYEPGKSIFLPNYYPTAFQQWRGSKSDTHPTLHVGCFGAIRPLKNQLIQAMAALEFAREQKKQLVFHINGTRIEGRGDSILKNIRGLFANIPSTEAILIEHEWLTHAQFQKLISKMDIGMQVSFSESFNIVSADFISKGVPIVVSKEVDWVDSLSMAEASSIEDIKAKMNRNFKYGRRMVKSNQQKLKQYAAMSESLWMCLFKGTSSSVAKRPKLCRLVRRYF